MRFFFAVAVALLTLAEPSWSAVEIRAYSDTSGRNACISAPPGSQLVTLHIVVTGADELTGVSFRLNIPPTLVWLEDESVFAATTGASPTGITIGFNGCLAPPVHVLTVLLLSNGNWHCEYPQAVVVQDAVAIGCAAQSVAVTGGTTLLSDGPCVIPLAENPFPPDQAHAVSVNALLSWTVGPAVDCGAEGPYTRVYFGTQPNPPLLPAGQVVSPIDPGDLTPGTQYYWRVESIDYTYGTHLGPLWTFGTAGPLANKSSTWGKVKALYR